MIIKLNTINVKYKAKNKKIKKHIKIVILLLVVLVLSAILFKKFNYKLSYGQDVNKYLDNTKNTENIEIINEDNLDNKNSNNSDESIGLTESNESIGLTESDDFNPVVSESELVSNDFFDDAVFIGDSRTEGFIIANSLSNIKSLTVKGLMVDTVFKRQAINMNGEKITVAEALSKIDFKKVYIMLGVNELGWPYEEVFIKKYSELIDYIKLLNDKSQIYIQSIIPVSYEKSSTDKIYNNNNINNFNNLIINMCKEKQVYYVDVKECLIDEEGNLPVGASSDGVHLIKDYSNKWYEYLKSHTIQNELE